MGKPNPTILFISYLRVTQVGLVISIELCSLLLERFSLMRAVKRNSRVMSDMVCKNRHKVKRFLHSKMVANGNGKFLCSEFLFNLKTHGGEPSLLMRGTKVANLDNSLDRRSHKDIMGSHGLKKTSVDLSQ